MAAFAVSIVTEAGDDAFAGHLTMAFFLAGSVAATMFGRRIDAVGPRRCAAICGVGTAVVALPLLSARDTPLAMIVGCGVSGAAFAVTLPATNAVLQQVLPVRLLVIAVCVKQAAIPMALLLAAAVAPLASRPQACWAGAALALTAAGLFVVATRGIPAPRQREGGLEVISAVTYSPTHNEDRANAGLSRIGAVTLLASVAAGALIGYSALALSDAGISVSTAVRILAVANIAGITVRVLSGVISARYRLRTWWPVSALMVAGAIGLLGMATGQPDLVVGGCLCAFAFGWGWSGLAFALVLVDNVARPGASGAYLKASGMLGSALGPVLMALAVSLAGMTAGWMLVAGILTLAGGLASWTGASRFYQHMC